jgi:hypothetical protein
MTQDIEAPSGSGRETPGARPDPVAGEVPTRLSHIRTAMNAAGIESLLITSPENVYYTSGALIHTQAFIRRRQAAVILPAEGSPVLVVSEIEAGLARRVSQLGDIVTYREFEQSAVQRAADVLIASGQAQGRLGLELNALPADSYRQLAGLLPGSRSSRLIPCSEACAGVRDRPRRGRWHLPPDRSTGRSRERLQPRALGQPRKSLLHESSETRLSSAEDGFAWLRDLSRAGQISVSPTMWPVPERSSRVTRCAWDVELSMRATTHLWRELQSSELCRHPRWCGTSDSGRLTGIYLHQWCRARQGT